MAVTAKDVAKARKTYNEQVADYLAKREKKAEIDASGNMLNPAMTGAAFGSMFSPMGSVIGGVGGAALGLLSGMSARTSQGQNPLSALMGSLGHGLMPDERTLMTAATTAPALYMGARSGGVLGKGAANAASAGNATSGREFLDAILGIGKNAATASGAAPAAAPAAASAGASLIPPGDLAAPATQAGFGTPLLNPPAPYSSAPAATPAIPAAMPATAPTKPMAPALRMPPEGPPALGREGIADFLRASGTTDAPLTQQMVDDYFELYKNARARTLTPTSTGPLAGEGIGLPAPEAALGDWLNELHDPYDYTRGFTPKSDSPFSFLGTSRTGTTARAFPHSITPAEGYAGLLSDRAELANPFGPYGQIPGKDLPTMNINQIPLETEMDLGLASPVESLDYREARPDNSLTLGEYDLFNPAALAQYDAFTPFGLMPKTYKVGSPFDTPAAKPFDPWGTTQYDYNITQHPWDM